MFSVYLMVGRVSPVTALLRALPKLSLHLEKKPSPQVSLQPPRSVPSPPLSACLLLLPLHKPLLAHQPPRIPAHSLFLLLLCHLSRTLFPRYVHGSCFTPLKASTQMFPSQPVMPRPPYFKLWQPQGRVKIVE